MPELRPYDGVPGLDRLDIVNENHTQHGGTGMAVSMEGGRARRRNGPRDGGGGYGPRGHGGFDGSATLLNLKASAHQQIKEMAVSADK